MKVSSISLLLLSTAWNLVIDPVSGCPFMGRKTAATEQQSLPSGHETMVSMAGKSQKTQRRMQDDPPPPGTIIDMSSSSSEDDAQPYEFVCDFSGSSAEEAIASAKFAIEQSVLSADQVGPKFLRLTFHDCVGGCNGSVDMNDSDNAGLQLPMDELKPLVECYSDYLTRADIWVLAGMTSIEVLQDDDDDNIVDFPLQYYGRVSLEDETTGSGEMMPAAHLTTAETLAFFEDAFGFSPQETVAIMGAHTLGELNAENSGFRGKWVADEDEVDNDFYEVLVDTTGLPNSELTQIISTNGQYLWKLPGVRGEVMLNADMSIVSDLEGYLNATTGEASCIPQKTATDVRELPECPPASTLEFAVQYADDNDQWLLDFRAVMLKMTNQGSENLTAVNQEQFQSAYQALTTETSPSSSSSSFWLLLLTVPTISIFWF